MFTDTIIDLVEAGVITGKRKTLDRGKVVASFCMGTRKLYDYIDGNPAFSFHPTEYVNDSYVISRQYRQVAINVALEVDLTGQVCADSLGTQFYSGIGGQVDFNRGAARCAGGKAIIALPSTARNGSISRIVTRLSPGAGVVTTRGDVHYVVTEYGVAYLHGKNVQERAIALISIAHPDFRPRLLQEAVEAKYLRPDLARIEGKLVVGPPDFRTTHVLEDGTLINFRSIRPTDEPRMRDLFYALSQETIYYRYHFPHDPDAAQAGPGLRLHQPPHGGRHCRNHHRGLRGGPHCHRPLLSGRDDQHGRGRVRGAGQLADQRHRIIPACLSHGHCEAARHPGIHRRSAAREPADASRPQPSALQSLHPAQ